MILIFKRRSLVGNKSLRVIVIGIRFILFFGIFVFILLIFENEMKCESILVIKILDSFIVIFFVIVIGFIYCRVLELEVKSLGFWSYIV